MNTITEVTAFLSSLEQKEGKEAVHTWVLAHLKELPDGLQEEVLLRYSVDAFIEGAEDQALINDAIADGTDLLEELTAEKRAMEDELKKRDVQERLQGNG